LIGLSLFLLLYHLPRKSPTYPPLIHSRPRGGHPPTSATSRHLLFAATTPICLSLLNPLVIPGSRSETPFSSIHYSREFEIPVCSRCLLVDKSPLPAPWRTISNISSSRLPRIPTLTLVNIPRQAGFTFLKILPPTFQVASPYQMRGPSAIGNCAPKRLQRQTTSPRCC